MAFQPFAWHLPENYVLAGQLDSGAGTCEWEWMRVQAALGIHSKDFKYLKSNQQYFESELQLAQVPWQKCATCIICKHAHLTSMLHASSCCACKVPVQQLHYRGANAEDPSRLGHSVESRCLAVILCALPGRRQLPASCKTKCLLLLTLLLQAAIRSLTTQAEAEPISGCIYDVGHTPHNVILTFDENGMTKGLACMSQVDEQSAAGWQRLTSAGWCGRKVTSALENMSLWDLVLFCAWSKANSNHIWHQAFEGLYPKLLDYIGRLLDAHCKVLAAGGPKPVPVLRSKDGNVRRMARSNKIILLDRCSQLKKNREEGLGTHKDVACKKAKMITQEAKLEVALYMQKVVRTFLPTTQVQVSWDESQYDSSTMVIAAWDFKQRVAAFLPCQEMSPVYTHELDDEIQVLCHAGTAQRVEGFSTLRALSHSLSSIGLPLESFKLDEKLIARPLQAHESRVFSDGEYWVFNQKTGEVVRQIPDGMALDQQPVLISVSDQGPLNVPALDMCAYRLKLSMHNQWDCYHRVWILS